MTSSLENGSGQVALCQSTIFLSANLQKWTICKFSDSDLPERGGRGEEGGDERGVGEGGGERVFSSFLLYN